MVMLIKQWGKYLFILLCLVVIHWLYLIQSGFLPQIDIWSQSILHDFIGAKPIMFFRWVTELGSTTFLMPFVVCMSIVLFVLYRQWLIPIIYLLGCLSGWATNHMIKLMVERERPSIWEAVEGTGYSFPSGHATSSMICYGLLIYFLIRNIRSEQSRLWIVLAISVLILLIGVSRYVIHVHYVTDIIAGFNLGWMMILIWTKMFAYLSKMKQT